MTELTTSTINSVEREGELVLRTNRTKNLLFLFGSIAFTAAGVWMLGEHPIVGWASITFFGIGSLVFAIISMPGASTLRLTRDGFTTTTLFRRMSYRWDDIAEFGVFSLGNGGDMVGMNFSKSFADYKALRKLNVGLSGYEGSLPETYGMSASGLVEVLRRWKGRGDNSVV